MIVWRAICWVLVELTVFFLSIWHYLVSPFFGCRCRFYPSCSQYAAEAIRTRGLIRGLGLAARRLCRCNALTPGGYEPPTSEKSPV